MEGLGGHGFSGVAKRPRTAGPKRLRQDLQIVVDGRDVSPPASTPSSDNGSKQSSDKNNARDTLIPKKDFNLNGSAPRSSTHGKTESVPALKKMKRDDKKYGNIDDFYENGSTRGGRNGSDSKRSREGALTPANGKSASKSKEVSEKHSNSLGVNVEKSGERRNRNQPVEDSNGSAENKQRKLKLKVGGVTRTIRPKPENGNDGGSSSKPPRPSDAPRHRQKLILPDDSDDDAVAEDVNGLQGVSHKDSSDGSSAHKTNGVSHGNMAGESSFKEQTHKSHVSPYSEAARKSKRVPKRRKLDGAFDDEDEDDEVQYLNKLKNLKAGSDRNIEVEDGGEGGIKKRRVTSVSKNKKTGYDVDNDYGSSQKSKDNKKKPRSEREPDKKDDDEEELDSGDGSDAEKKTQEDIDVEPETRKEPLTTRQRALQSGKGADVGGSSIEFPDGLPPAAPRRTKVKLSEVEQQAKKAEAAQRRKLLVKKQAEEQKAEAIKKILCQESSRKKKEEKERKERDEKAQKKATESLVVAANNIRWVMGPTGTVVTFGEDVGLPSIFCSKPCSYPPPREKCAGPSCTNAYKYRDSKLNLPLCSLRCYKAVQETNQSVSTC